jgi:hypothetical protein
VRFYTRPRLAQLLHEFRFESVRISAVAGMPGARQLLLARALRARW